MQSNSQNVEDAIYTVSESVLIGCTAIVWDYWCHSLFTCL